MLYENIETGRKREFSKGMPIPKEYKLIESPAPMTGKHHSENAKRKIGELNKLKMTGKHWYNNGKESVLDYECPEGFSPGRLKTKN
jgi:hypothetical protein